MKASLPYVCPLEAAEDAAGCGGKAHNLGRMLRLGFPVPPGRVVTNRAFQELLDANGLRLPFPESGSPEHLRSLAATMRQRVLAAAIPDAVWQAILQASGRTLIVRSSAVGEDGGQASFAGQLDSFANIRCEDELRTALLACWASYWSERSLFYQHARGVRLCGMGVIIQEQVDARFSGVLFTHSPDEPGADAPLLVETCPGLGDALVGGRVNPARVIISRHDLRCRRLADGDSATAPEEAHLVELARAGLRLEKVFGRPQDIEWALGWDGRLYLVQCRPITTAPRAESAGRVAWSNANVNENFPEPICPLLYSIAAEGYYHYFRNLGLAFGIDRQRVRAMEQPLRHLIGVHGARMYYNLTNIHAVLRQAPFGERLAEFFNHFVGATPTPPATGPQVRRGRLRQLVEVGRIACRAAWQFLFLPTRVRDFERTAEAFAAATHPDRLTRMSPSELLTALRDFLEIRFHRWTNAALADAAAMLSYGLLRQTLRKEFPDADLAALHNTLLKGLTDVVSGEPVRRLWELSGHLRHDPALAKLFAEQTWEEVLTEVRARPEFAAFRADFEDYLEHWGFRCSGELMLTTASFQEAPERLLEMLAAYAGRDGPGPAEVLARQQAERTAETDRVLRILRGRGMVPGLPWPSRAVLVRILLRWTQRAIALRERVRLKQALLYSRCRRIALALGDRLVQAGSLQTADDIFFLTHPEIDQLLAGAAMFPYQLRDLVRLRRSAHAELSALKPPDTFELAEGAYLPAGPTPAAPASQNGHVSGGDEMTGAGACGGQASGPAAVLCDLSEIGLLRGGDVLVTRQTDPGWGPVFFLIKGLVMERGGMLSHGAILAREYGIPTVVGVPEATRRIAGGQHITVNGDRGVVHVGH